MDLAFEQSNVYIGLGSFKNIADVAISHSAGQQCDIPTWNGYFSDKTAMDLATVGELV